MLRSAFTSFCWLFLLLLSFFLLLFIPRPFSPQWNHLIQSAKWNRAAGSHCCFLIYIFLLFVKHKIDSKVEMLLYTLLGFYNLWIQNPGIFTPSWFYSKKEKKSILAIKKSKKTRTIRESLSCWERKGGEVSMVTPNQYTQRPGLLLFSTGWAIHPSEFILPLSRFIYSKERGRKSVDPSMVYPLFGGRSSNRCRKEKLFFFFVWRNPFSGKLKLKWCRNHLSHCCTMQTHTKS